VEEDSPRRERVLKDLVEFVVAPDEDHAAGGALHRLDEVVLVDLLSLGVAGRGVLCDLTPDLLHRQAARQQVERVVLCLGDHLPQRVQVRIRREQPGDRRRVLVDAEPGQVRVADVREQAGIGGTGGLLERGLYAA